MATFSTNQVKQLYVVKAAPEGALENVGDIAFFNAGDGQIAAKYLGNDGVVRTDLIDLATLKGKAVDAARKNLIKVPMVGTTLPHEVVGQYSGSRILLKPAEAGSGRWLNKGLRLALPSAWPASR